MAARNAKAETGENITGDNGGKLSVESAERDAGEKVGRDIE